MKRNSFLTFLREKSFIIVLTLMLVSAGTMAALFTLDTEEQSEGNEMAKQEMIQSETAKELAEENISVDETANLLPETRIAAKKTDTKEKVIENATVNMENAVMEAELEDQYLEAVEEMAEVSGTDVIAEGFSENPVISLQWPVEGDVLMPFSMDQSIYFTTLAQYQYNPAMIISAVEGTEVFAAAAGTVTAVDKSNEYGHYIKVDAGNGFELIYGQLFDISVEVGEQLEAGERMAKVAYPTRSYLEEGDNLYFRVISNGTSVDPALYLAN